MKPHFLKSTPAFTKAGAQREVQKIIIGRHGTVAFREFLRTPQPAFDDATGREILENQPFALLEKLNSEGGAFGQ